MKGEEETMCFVFLNNSYFSEGVLHSLRLSASLLWKISMFSSCFLARMASVQLQGHDPASNTHTERGALTPACVISSYSTKADHSAWREGS